MLITTPTKPSSPRSTFNDYISAIPPNKPHGLLIPSSPIPPSPVKPDPEPPTKNPVTQYITQLRVTREEEKKSRHLPLRTRRSDTQIANRQEATAAAAAEKKKALLNPRLALLKKKEESSSKNPILHSPIHPSSTRITKSKQATRFSTLKTSLIRPLTPIKTPANKSTRFRGGKAENFVRQADWADHVRLGVTPLMLKSSSTEEVVGLAGVDIGDVRAPSGMGLCDGDTDMSAKVMWLRKELWGKGRWAVRDEEAEMFKGRWKS